MSARTHEAFLEELRASGAAVERVASWLLQARGVPILRRPHFEAPTVEQRAEYADEGDLELLLRVEVKRRSLAFTGRADYPFPSVIVDAVPNFDKKRPAPFAYMILNETMSAGLWLEVSRTRRSWDRAHLFDRRNQVEQPFYTCPLELASEVTLT